MSFPAKVNPTTKVVKGKLKFSCTCITSRQSFMRKGAEGRADSESPRLGPGIPQNLGRSGMNDILLKRYLQIRDLIDRQEGQDLVEYALVVALISLGATATMGHLATGISTAFSNLSSRLGTNVT